MGFLCSSSDIKVVVKSIAVRDNRPPPPFYYYYYEE